MGKHSRLGRPVDSRDVKHATQDERAGRFFGMESRQVVRAALRRTHGHGPGKERFRALRGLCPHPHCGDTKKEKLRDSGNGEGDI